MCGFLPTLEQRKLRLSTAGPEIEDKPGALALPPVSESVIFDNVSFSYGEGKPAVQNFTPPVAAFTPFLMYGPTRCGYGYWEWSAPKMKTL